MSKDFKIYIYDILERTRKILDYTKHLTEQKNFEDNDLMQDAVIRNLEVIGEAAKRIPDSFRQKYPDVPWKDIAGLRDLLIHQYSGISVTIIWDILQTELPALEKKMAQIILQLENDCDSD